MFNYLYTNDMRISELPSSIKRVSEILLSGQDLYQVDKSFGNNGATIQFYFNLQLGTETLSMGQSDVLSCIRNFVLKFQFPNTRTSESLKNCISDGIYFAPFRAIVSTLVFMSKNEHRSYLTHDEILYFFFCNQDVCRAPNFSVDYLVDQILSFRNNPHDLKGEIFRLLSWKQYERQLREMMTVLQYSATCFKNTNGRVTYSGTPTEDEQSFIESLLTYKSIWFPTNPENYSLSSKEYTSYMDTNTTPFQIIEFNNNPKKKNLYVEDLTNQPLQQINSDDPTKFVWSCIKLFSDKQDLKQLFTSKYKSLGGSIGNYIRINECYVAQIGKSDIKEIETIQIYDGSFLNAGFDARDIEQFADAVNDVFRGKYKIETEQKGSQIIYKLIQLQINLDYRPYITAIKSKPFLLLAGISGTGKSRIVRELARACWDAGSEEYKAHKPSNFEMVQVKPNWHDSSELIGYVSRVSGDPVYVAGPFLKFVAKAWENPDVPYFLCLDEMNLAPVEQYFAEYLSVVESRKAEDGVIKTDPILPKSKEDWYRILTAELTLDDMLRERFLEDGICIPQNLIVVGTVNMDETTFSFSRKVLDRAMTIEMNEVDLTSGLDKKYEGIGKLDKTNLIGTAVEGCDVYNTYKSDCDTAIAYLNAVNQHLEKTPFKVAYRTRNEFLLYVVNNLPYNKDQDGKDVQHGWLLARALDEITCMKVLSRIEGDETKVSKEFLSELTKEIRTQLEKLGGCTYTAIRAEENKENNVWYSKSLDKLDEMTKRLESGYTSFWS